MPVLDYVPLGLNLQDIVVLGKASIQKPSV
jgi:hypothetical protein